MVAKFQKKLNQKIGDGSGYSASRILLGCIPLELAFGNRRGTCVSSEYRKRSHRQSRRFFGFIARL